MYLLSGRELLGTLRIWSFTLEDLTCKCAQDVYSSLQPIRPSSPQHHSLGTKYLHTHIYIYIYSFMHIKMCTCVHIHKHVYAYSLAKPHRILILLEPVRVSALQPRARACRCLSTRSLLFKDVCEWAVPNVAKQSPGQ